MQSEEELTQALRACLKCYNDALSSGKPEREVDTWITRLEALVPHARFSDLYFWGERERTEDEMIEEAVRRQQIWHSDGELALLLHLEAQLSSAASEPDLLPPFRHYTVNELPRIRQEIAAFAGKRTH